MQSTRKMNNHAMLSALKSANSILLCTHISPDGDAIGSMLAAGRMLERMGKQITMACADSVPQRLRFLPGADRIVQVQQLEGRTFDLAFALDAADEKRLGECIHAYMAAPVRIQMDHHGTNPCYAQHNEVDGHASSTGCMVYRLMQALDVTPDPEMAACIYTAISTDTGNFCFANTDEETFACAGAMQKTGFDLNEVARNVHLVREVPHVRLLAQALSTLHLFADGNCACMMLSAEDYARCGALPEHSDTIVNYALYLPGVKMAYLLDTRELGMVKVSFRAIAPCHVADIARQLGGGGHDLSAGCRTQMSAQEAEMLIQQAMTRQIEEMK